MFTPSGNFRLVPLGLVRRRFSFQMRRAKLRMVAALRHWALPEWNPFLAHELRRSLRHKSGPFFVLWPLLFTGFLLALAARFRDGLASEILQFAADEEIPLSLAEHALGENTISFMALSAAGVCGYAALLHAKRAAQIFVREKASGTFPQLLLLPLAETRLAFLTSAPGAASALSLWSLLMPLWLLALATNQWSWREFLGLPVLLLALTIRPPEWTPAGEEFVFDSAQNNLGEDEEVKDETEKELEENPTAKTQEPPVNDKKSSGAINSKFEDDIDDPGEDDYGDYVSDPRYQRLFKFDPAGTITLFIVWQIALFWARFAGFKTPPSVFNYLLPLWREFLPPEVWKLVPSLLLSWPLFLIHLLVTPLPFFSVALPPGLWLLPRLVMGRCATFSVFRLSYLGRHSLQHRRWGRGWLLLKRGQAYLFWFFGAGFLWPWLVHKGAFAALLPNAPINASWARAALWTALLIIITWVISARFHSVLGMPFKKYNQRTTRANLSSWRRTWRQNHKLLFWPIAIYFVLCWLGGTSGLDAIWLSRLTPTLLVMAAYLTADFGTLTLKNALPENRRHILAWLRFGWFWGLLWEAVFRIGYAHYSATSFDLSDAPHLLLSPFVSLLALLSSDIILPLQGALWQLGLSLFIFTATALLTFQSKVTIEPQAVVKPNEEMTAEQAALWAQLKTLWRIIWFVPGWILRVLFWPIRTFFVGLYHLLIRIKNAIQPFLNRQSNALWQWMESFDNPILRRASKTMKVDELAVNWLGCLGLQGLVLAILLGLALIKPVSLLFYGGNTGFNRQAALAMLHWRSWGDVVFAIVVAIGLIVNIAVLSSQTKAFDKERTNGGMVFLFLTPLTEIQIIGGYMGAAFLPGAWLHSALYPFILLAAMLEMMAGRFTLLPLLLLLTILLHTLLVWSAVTSIWAAVRAKKTGEGGLWASVGAMPQIILIIALLFGLSRVQGFLALGATSLAIMLSAFATHFFWNDALRRLHHERFGDISLQGTIAN
jgi:hypothetical protein